MHNNILLLSIAVLLTGCASQQPLTSENDKQTSPISPIAEKVKYIDVTLAEVEAIEKKLSIPDSIWPRLTDNFELVEKNNHSNIAPHIDWFTNNQSYMDRITKRGSLYLFYILGEVQQRGMPNELALLPAIESAFNPQAYSHSHAAGLWQFIPISGERFGLERNWWKDDRRDVIDSTQAALDYLEYLHKYFDDDWLLAIAAYNCGEGTVRKAIKRNKKLGKPTDFWSLKLPKETRNYVPRLLALSKVIQQPKQHGIHLQNIPNTPYFEVITLPNPINLSVAAQMATIDYATITALNPAFKRKVTAPEGPHRILLPIQATQAFNLALATTPAEQWTPMEQYLVKRGDSLYKIAKTHHLRIDELIQYNGLSSNILQIGQRLDIPGSGAPSAQAAVVYTVKKGDSLWEIARRQKTSVKNLASWNNISAKATLKPGQKLKMMSSNAVPAEQVKKLTYRVRRGDSLSRIASNFYLSVADILSWNQLNKKSYLQPGQRLTLFVDLNKI